MQLRKARKKNSIEDSYSYSLSESLILPNMPPLA